MKSDLIRLVVAGVEFIRTTPTSSVVHFLHSDHLGSTSLTTDASGVVIARQLYDAWGNVRLRGDVKTDIGYTSQREEVDIHAMFYRARYYSPSLGRFLSADSIIPGAADGSGGGAGTLGVDSGSRLTTLTTDFHEFIGQVTQENQAVLQYGPFFQWSEKVRKDNPVPSGPLNPQALNRYAYCLNNPLRYVDPTGHEWVAGFSIFLTFNDLGAWTLFYQEVSANIKALNDSAAWSGLVLGNAAGGVDIPTGVVIGLAATCGGGGCQASYLQEYLDALDTAAKDALNNHREFKLGIKVDYFHDILNSEHIHMTIYSPGAEGLGRYMQCYIRGNCPVLHFLDALSRFIVSPSSQQYWEKGTLSLAK